MVDANITGISEAELAKFRAQMRKFTEKKTKQLQDMTMLSGFNITSNAKKEVPRYQSRLYNSLRPLYSRNKLSVRVWTDVNYAPFVEFGTKSKAKIPTELAGVASQFKSKGVGNFDEFLKNIEKWCKSKGIDPGAAYPIAISLIKNGQKAQPFLYPAFKAERTKYVQALKTLMARP